jgi:hypothetical protein
MSLPLRYVFYKPKSLPHFGKLMHSNEVVALLGRRELPRRCGWIIYTIQDACLRANGDDLVVIRRSDTQINALLEVLPL